MANKDIFLKIDLEEGTYAKKLSTNEIIKDNLELYYQVTDNNGYYYPEPIFDNIDDYNLIINAKEVSLKNYLEFNGYLNDYFAIINIERKCITSISNFKVHKRNSFYSIPIHNKLANFLKSFRLSDLKVINMLFNINLISYESDLTNINRNGYELLFYLESDRSNIMASLNAYRVKVLTEIIITKTENRKWNNVTLFLPDKITFRYSLDLKNKVESYLKKNVESSKFELLDNLYIDYLSMQNIKYLLDKREVEYDFYCKWYIKYITNVYSKIKSLSDLSKYDNFLIYGYYTEEN